MLNESDRLPEALIHPTSKSAYVAQIIGMWTKFMRTFLFNLLMFFVGISIGMGFSILHIQRAWRQKSDHATIYNIGQQLHSLGVDDNDIKKLLMQLYDKHLKEENKNKKPSK